MIFIVMIDPNISVIIISIHILQENEYYANLNYKMKLSLIS